MKRDQTHLQDNFTETVKQNSWTSLFDGFWIRVLDLFLCFSVLFQTRLKNEGDLEPSWIRPSTKRPE